MIRWALAGLLLCQAAARAEEAPPLTGISRDWSRYRLGKTTVCRMATADVDGRVLYEAEPCAPMPVKEQAKLGFFRPRPATWARLADGSVLRVSITLDPPPARTGEVGCITTAGGHCPTPEEVAAAYAFMPRPATLRVVRRAKDGSESVVAVTDGTPRELVALHAPPTGKQVVVVFTYEKTLRDSPAEAPIGVGVLGVELQPTTP